MKNLILLLLMGGTALARDWRCKALVVEDQSQIAEATAEQLSACVIALKEKVKAAKCENGAPRFEFLSQTEVAPGKWSRGAKLSVKCK